MNELAQKYDKFSLIAAQVDENDWKYVCHLCDSRFCMASALYEHLRSGIHTGNLARLVTESFKDYLKYLIMWFHHNKNQSGAGKDQQLQ